MSAAPAAIPVEERLFSLVLALLATENGLTKAEILETVQGYRQRYKVGDENANLERQFERDKDDIRDLGVPLETVEQPGEPGNNQNLRYRIPRAAYELPSDISFTSSETALLNLAAQVWREGSLSAESRRAIVKLRALGATADEPVIGYAPRLSLRDAAFDPLRIALEKGNQVRFAYLKPGEQVEHDRHVIPLALVQYQGRWHLAAEDVRTGFGKTFLLRRIVGPVRTAGVAPERPGDHGAKALTDLEALAERNVATVDVLPDSDAAVRLANRRGTERSGNRFTIHFVDAAILADELAGFGPEVHVVAPDVLREAVIERLERTAADHA